MLYEYAIQPEVLYLAAKTPRESRDLVRHFGIGEPNVFSGFPQYKRFKSQVLRNQPAELTDLDQERLLELVRFLGGIPRVVRAGEFNSAEPWISNISEESARARFDHILTAEELNIENALSFSKFLDGFKDHPRQIVVERKAAAMAAAIGNMLRLARKIVLVDQHFCDKPRFWQPFLSFLEASIIAAPSGPKEVIVCYNALKPGCPSVAYLANKLKQRHVDLVRSCESITFKGIKEIDGNEKFHNRYVLTDLGAVSFGIGLDEGLEGQTDDVQLLGDALYNLRWLQYADLEAFEVVEECRA